MVPHHFMEGEDQAVTALLQARKAYEEALAKFNEADTPELVDAAIYELLAAEKRLDNLLRRAGRRAV